MPVKKTQAQPKHNQKSTSEEDREQARRALQMSMDVRQ